VHFDPLTLNDNLDALRYSLAAISLLFALAYQVIESQPANAMRTIFKTASISFLVPLPLLALGEGPSLALIALALALACGSAGDYFLALKSSERDFKRGIIAFLIGHIFYLVAMLPHLAAPSALQMAGIALLAFMAVGVCWWLGAKLGPYKKPIWAYMAVISTMALAALCMPSPMAGLGALLFVFSDAVIVVNQFGRPVPHRGPIVWVTYYAGQALLAGSLLAMLAS
jgi:uncharacterized membrane protein YhhN